MRFTSSSVLIFAFCFFAMLTADAWAYLDPVGGSMIVQVLVMGVASLIVAIKLYWKKLLSVFGLGAKEDSATRGDGQTEK